MKHRFATAALIFSLIAGQAQADGYSGPYLAARQADMANDFAAAADYYARALARDTNNDVVLRDLVLAKVALGEVDRAALLARQLNRLVPEDEIAGLVETATLLKTGAPDDILSFLSPSPKVGPMVDGLLMAWAELDAGRVGAALDRFDLVAEQDSMRPFARFHKAMALAVVGDYEASEALFSQMLDGDFPVTRRGMMALAQLLAQLDRRDDAVGLLTAQFGPSDAEVQALIADLQSDRPVPFTVIRTAREGYAETFYSVAAALSGQASDRFALLYLRIAEYLAPTHTDAILLGADLLNSLGQYDLAVASYASIPRDSALAVTAEIERAETLLRADRADEGIEVLQALAGDYPDRFDVQKSLGDALRRESRFEESRAAYDRALASLSDTDPQPWTVYYTRGITLERIGDWPAAEADFRKALELSPDQPFVLNYLGYSFVERQENLDEALDMIRRAVDARPESGFITDSLGWVLYRLGQYDEAVVHMERAVELEPVDPTVNDHLGDVYWAVGREREAQFQWSRALSFDPEEDVADRIRRKLEVGLDTVLQEEGAPPLRPTE